MKLLDSWIPDSFHIWKVNIRRHSGAQMIVIARQANFDPEHLFDPVCDGLHVARSELCLPVYLLDDAIEIRVRKRIDSNADVLAQLD